MFDSKQTLTNRLADAVDLAIDFATLGEYGLEPVGSTPRGCEADRPTCVAPARTRETHLRELYAICTPRQSAPASTCTSKMQANPFQKPGLSRGSGRDGARRRGSRGASMAFRAAGAA